MKKKNKETLLSYFKLMIVALASYSAFMLSKLYVLNFLEFLGITNEPMQYLIIILSAAIILAVVYKIPLKKAIKSCM